MQLVSDTLDKQWGITVSSKKKCIPRLPQKELKDECLVCWVKLKPVLGILLQFVPNCCTRSVVGC